MAYQLVFTDSSKRQIKKLDRLIQKRVQIKLLEAVSLSDVSSISIRLTGEWSRYRRLRVGAYRVVFYIDNNKFVVHRVQHRKDVYR